MSLKILDREHFNEARDFARKLGGDAWRSFIKNLRFLATYSDNKTECRLGSDFAPYSFSFAIMKSLVNIDTHPVTGEEVFGPPPSGMSQQEWDCLVTEEMLKICRSRTHWRQGTPLREVMREAKARLPRMAYWFNGGLIYHGPTSPGDGSFPALSVSLSSSNKPRWEIHT